MSNPGGGAEDQKSQNSPERYITLQEFRDKATVLAYGPSERSLVFQANAANEKEITLVPGATEIFSPGTFTFGGEGDYKLTYAYIDNTQLMVKSGDPYAEVWAPSTLEPPRITGQATTPNPSRAPEPPEPKPSLQGSSSQASATESSNGTASATIYSSGGKSSSNNGVSSGAAAGIAIGCLIAGALIAGVVVWSCLRRARRSRRGPVQDATALTFLPSKGNEPLVKSAPVTGVRPLSEVMDTALPQPLEDKAITSGISGISNAIKNHVQSFYHSSRVNPVLLDQADLHALGSNLPISTGTVSTLLGDPDTRETALRFCIAWVVLSRMQLSSSPNTSFLPGEIVQCYENLLANRDASQSEYATSLRNPC